MGVPGSSLFAVGRTGPKPHGLDQVGAAARPA
jgi:hypothetical protein